MVKPKHESDMILTTTREWRPSEQLHDCERCSMPKACCRYECDEVSRANGWFSAYQVQRQKYDRIVAVDPDNRRSGVAVWDTKTQAWDKVCTMDFAEMLGFLDRLAAVWGKRAVVIVEASWLISHNWHLSGLGSRARSAAIGRSVGLNHQTGLDIIAACRHFGLEAVEQLPLKKCWKGKDGKITAEEIRKVTGYDKRSNQEERDAMLLCWVKTGRPIRVSANIMPIKCQ